MKDEDLFKLLPKETRAAAIDAKIKLNSLIQQNEELKHLEAQEVEGIKNILSPEKRLATYFLSNLMLPEN